MVFLPAAPTRVKKIPKYPQEKQKIYNGKGTILLVDDEEGVIEVCSEMLKNLGYRVKAVTDGREAIDILKANDLRIDLVILDMVMPKISGQQTFEQMKTINPDIKVEYISTDSVRTNIPWVRYTNLKTEGNVSGC